MGNISHISTLPVLIILILVSNTCVDCKEDNCQAILFTKE